MLFQGTQCSLSQSQLAGPSCGPGPEAGRGCSGQVPVLRGRSARRPRGLGEVPLVQRTGQGEDGTGASGQGAGQRARDGDLLHYRTRFLKREHQSLSGSWQEHT